MDISTAINIVETVGVPAVIVAAIVVMLWRLGGRLLTELVTSYRERIDDLAADRDHFRDRAEAHDDRTNGLCRELIDEARHRLGPQGTKDRVN